MFRVPGLREVTQQVVTSVQGHVSLPRVLRRVIEDPETAGGNLADLRQLVMGNFKILKIKVMFYC